MLSLIKLLTFLTLFITPLLAATLEFGYEQIKVYFFLNVTLITAFLWIWALINKQLKFPSTKLTAFATIFILILGLSSYFGVDQKSSLLGRQPYIQGLLIYFSLFLFFLIVSTIRFKLIDLAWFLSLSSLMVAFLSIKDWVSLNFFGIYIPTYSGRVVSSFGQPNLYSGFLLFTLPFWYLLTRERKKYFAYLGILTSAVAILISQSRAAILVLFLLMFIFVLTKLQGKIKFKITALFLTVSFVAFLALSIWGSFLINKEFGSFTKDDWYINYSPERRAHIWPVIGQLILSRPLQGYGLETLPQEFNKSIWIEGAKQPFFADLKNLSVDRSHNYTLDLLFFSGVLGFAAWLLLIGYMFKISNGFFRIWLIVYLIWIQLQIQGLNHLMLFWFLAGFVNNSSLDKNK